MTPKQTAYKLQATQIISAMEKRHFEAFYCETKEDALNKALSLMEKGAVVTSGGSATVSEIGLLDHVKNSGDYNFIDRSTAKTEDEKREIFSKAVLADYYLMGSNAFTMDGQLVNIDGNGNRVAALCYGPKHVIIVVGMNKLATTVDAAYDRIRLSACPPNCLRLNLKNPCSVTGFCGDCKSDSSICSSFVTTRLSRYPDRIKVILVGEELGY